MIGSTELTLLFGGECIRCYFLEDNMIILAVIVLIIAGYCLIDSIFMIGKYDIEPVAATALLAFFSIAVGFCLHVIIHW